MDDYNSMSSCWICRGCESVTHGKQAVYQFLDQELDSLVDLGEANGSKYLGSVQQAHQGRIVSLA